jgi:hypothetical protein
MNLAYLPKSSAFAIGYANGCKMKKRTQNNNTFYLENEHIVPLSIGDPEAFYKYCKDENKELHYVDAEIVEKLKSKFDFQPADNWEHEAIYPIERFTIWEDMKGNIRRDAAIFMRANKYRFLEYESAMFQDVVDLMDVWNEQSTHPTDCDKKMFTYLNNIDMDNYMGYVVYADNRIAGCTFGEQLNCNTHSMAIVKCNREYKGINYALQHLFAKELEKIGIKYVNYTNLTEIKGLREQKLRMKPIKFAIPYYGKPI